MDAHDRDVLPAIDALGRGVSVEVVATFPWKWQAIGRRISSHYESRGWRVLSVGGDATVRTVAFFSIGLAGVGGSETRPPTLASALQDLGARFGNHPGLIVVTDAGHVDPQSRGVLLHASRRWGVPLLVLRTLEPNGEGGFGLTGAYTYELAPITPEEFRTGLENRLRSKVDLPAAVRVFNAVGGDLDLGVSIVEAGLWDGTFERQDDVLAVAAWRWSASYRRPVEAVLEHLDPASRAGLAALAAAGPVPVDEARDLVPDDLLGRLQASNHLAVVEDGTRACLLVKPPVVADCLRRTTSRLMRGAAVAEGTRGPTRLALLTPSAQERAGQLINLAEEKGRRDLLEAELAWADNPCLEAAVQLLGATIATGVSVDESLWAAVRDPSFVPDLADPAVSRQAVELQAMRWTLEARDRGSSDEAVARLRDVAAAASPAARAYLLVRAARLELAHELTFDAAPLIDIGRQEDLPSWVNDGLWVAVAGSSLCRGQVTWAMDALDNVRDAEAFDDEFHLLGCLVAVALFRADEGALRRRLAQLQALAESSGSMVALQVSAAFHAGVSLAGFTGPEFEVPRELGIQLGLPLERGPAGLLGATFAAASFNAFDPWLGFLVTTYDMRAGRDRLSPRCRLLVDGWARAHDLIVAGDTGSAAEGMVVLGDRLRELGAEQAAIEAYLVAVETAPPDSEILNRIQEGLAPVEMELVALYRDHPLPEGEKDGSFWRGVAETFEKAGLTGAAARIWKRAITAHRTTGEDEAREDAESRLDDLLRLRWTAEGVFHTPAEAPLTDREREIAELIATGLSNRDIATALSLSVRTVEAHAHRIFRKTGLSRRREVAAYLLHHPGSARMRRIG